MDRMDALQIIQESGIIAIVRLNTPEDLIATAEAICDGGVRVIEFTMTTPGAVEALGEAAARLPRDVILGAGTVLDAETARAVILAGAQFIVSPSLSPRTLEVCHRYGIACIPGAYTPTEIVTAWELGADLVKLFPATALGPRYVKDVLAPLPQVRLVPTGGVTLENIPEFIRAGAVAVGVGSSLVDRRLVEGRSFGELRERARAFATVVKEAKGYDGQAEQGIDRPQIETHVEA